YHEFPSFVAYSRERTDERSVNQELRLVSNGSGPWSWIGGLFFNDHEIDALSEEFTPGFPEFLGESPPTGDLEYRLVTRARQTERALFGEVSYRLAERWVLGAGGRLFDFESEQSMAREFVLAGIGGVDAAADSDDGFLGQISASYDASSDVLA